MALDVVEGTGAEPLLRSPDDPGVQLPEFWDREESDLVSERGPQGPEIRGHDTDGAPRLELCVRQDPDQVVGFRGGTGVGDAEVRQVPRRSGGRVRAVEHYVRLDPGRTAETLGPLLQLFPRALTITGPMEPSPAGRSEDQVVPVEDPDESAR